MRSCVSRNGVNPQGSFGLYPRKREYLGGCESADHPKITPTAEDLLRPNFLFDSGGAGFGGNAPVDGLIGALDSECEWLRAGPGSRGNGKAVFFDIDVGT